MSSSTKSRQKSCDQCANSKRQCDRGSPKCSRCTSKELSCQYKSDNSQVPTLDSMFSEQPGFQDVSLTLPLDFVPPNLSMVETGSLEFDDELFTAFNDYTMLNRRDPYDVQIGYMDRDRIRFIIRQMKTYPTLLVQNCKAPFIHPQASHSRPLVPPPLQDAISMAALYMSKNEKNEVMVWDIISTKAATLLEPRVSWSVAEHLACLQALVIYQIIRLFDGDIRARADAEKSEEILTDWTDRLVGRTGANTSTGTVLSSSWESWVFEESVSRTVVVSRMVQAMFMIVKQGFCTLVEAVTEMSFTSQKALWYAPTAVHWQQACKQNKTFYLHQMDFTELMEKGDLSEVDELGLLMLVCYKGVDGVNEWIVSKGGTALLE
ncbi:hypothetical protein L207DRAFT_551804 [Hyaloscypha variabilis F]|uniref:Zn(2)-C6 fungal-type domain-containing protein n=1 Tax=Hyaloscypha variabilis (strain UAMH 11265 / GT02V1 / F) TaxID=1149755 RepID=A0A2J6S258_HYAVF|nr:hypothetical protein L207DRAFT_551804 [Hyaloscypha variabilis F]